MEGTVTVSVKDFEHLRSVEKRLDQVLEKIRSGVIVSFEPFQEDEDEYAVVVTIDAENLVDAVLFIEDEFVPQEDLLCDSVIVNLENVHLVK